MIQQKNPQVKIFSLFKSWKIVIIETVFLIIFLLDFTYIMNRYHFSQKGDFYV